jgi:amino-acid N-acetyltransferase
LSADTKQYVSWFRHSSPYINAYRGKVFVILLPGEALAHDNFHNIAHDITLLNSLGVKLVLVHGARPQIDQALKAAGLKTNLQDEPTGKIHRPLRITDIDSLSHIKKVVGQMRVDIEAMFSMGLINSPMHGADINICGGNFVVAKPYGIQNGVDYALTGEIRKVNSEAILAQLASNNIVLLSNLGYSATGEVFNLASEEVAAETAIALNADKLLIYSKESGILDKEGIAFNKLSAEQAQKLIEEKSGLDGTDEALKNLQLGVKACLATVSRSQVISYVDDGALLTELFTRDGVGTLITQENYEQIRAACIEDIGGIMDLILPLEQEGTLVHRSREKLEGEIQHFAVIEREGMVIACAALFPHGDESAELACLATHSEYRNNSYGKVIFEYIEELAKSQKITKLFVLTTKSPHWFLEKGFTEGSVNSLPTEKKNLYNYQRNSKVLEKKL